MKKYILETLLQEAVKISRQGEVKDMPLVDLVKQSLEHSSEAHPITEAENDALTFLRRMEPISFEFAFNPNPEIKTDPLPENFPYKNCLIGSVGPVPEYVPTIDDQIKFMEQAPHTRLGVDYILYKKIIENLWSIKRWNETPVYHKEIDVAKVIDELLQLVYVYAPHRGKEYADQDRIQNALAAIAQINLFKQQRHEQRKTNRN